MAGEKPAEPWQTQNDPKRTAKPSAQGNGFTDTPALRGHDREKYSAGDEAKFARIGVVAALGAYTFAPGEQDDLVAFGAHCEAARAWGKAERAKLGL